MARTRGPPAETVQSARMRDPASPFLTSGYHDVPWEEPELLRACVRRTWKLKLFDSRQDALPALSTVSVPRSGRLR